MPDTASSAALTDEPPARARHRSGRVTLLAALSVAMVLVATARRWSSFSAGSSPINSTRRSPLTRSRSQVDVRRRQAGPRPVGRRRSGHADPDRGRHRCRHAGGLIADGPIAPVPAATPACSVDRDGPGDRTVPTGSSHDGSRPAAACWSSTWRPRSTTSAMPSAHCSSPLAFILRRDRAARRPGLAARRPGPGTGRAHPDRSRRHRIAPARSAGAATSRR